MLSLHHTNPAWITQTPLEQQNIIPEPLALLSLPLPSAGMGFAPSLFHPLTVLPIKPVPIQGEPGAGVGWMCQVPAGKV